MTKYLKKIWTIELESRVTSVNFSEPKPYFMALDLAHCLKISIEFSLADETVQVHITRILDGENL